MKQRFSQTTCEENKEKEEKQKIKQTNKHRSVVVLYTVKKVCQENLIDSNVGGGLNIKQVYTDE